jgi:hypothetical protein
MEKLYRYQGNTSLIQNWIDRDSKQREAVYKCSIKSELERIEVNPCTLCTNRDSKNESVLDFCHYKCRQ